MELIIALLITLSMTGAAWAQQTQPFSCASTAPGNVNVRQGPDESAAIVATIPPGGSVTGNGYDESRQWLSVVVQGKTGWASAQFFSCDAHPDAKPVEVPTVLTRTATARSAVQVAATPTTEGSPYGTMLTTEAASTPAPPSATDTLSMKDESTPTLCVYVFDDRNADGVRDDSEGTPQAAAYTLDGAAASGCSKAAAGLHIVEVSMPAGQQASISARWNVSLRAGQLTDLLVGASSPEALAARRQVAASTPVVPGTLVMAGGGGLLIAVVGASWLFPRSGRKNV